MSVTEIKSQLKEKGQQGTQQMIKNMNALQQLINAAEKLLIVVNTYNGANNALRNSISYYQNGNLKIIFKKLYDYMAQDQELTREIIKAQEQFQAAKNKVNNITMGLIYFDINSNKIIVSSQDAMAKFLKKYATTSTSKSGRGRGNVSLQGEERQKELIENDLNNDKIWKELTELINKISEPYKESVLDEALFRWANQDMYYKRRVQKQNTKKYKNSFYWWPTKGETKIGWSNSYRNRGYIAEGYIAALLDLPDSFKNPNDENEEENIKILNYYTAATNNKGASKEQDIVMNFNTGHLQFRYQFAVKSGSFSTARVGQYIKQALDVLIYKTIYSENSTDFLTKKIKYNNIIEYIDEEIKKIARKDFNGYVDKTLARIEKLSNDSQDSIKIEIEGTRIS